MLKCLKVIFIDEKHRQRRHDSFHSIILSAAAAAKSLQSCPTLCDPVDGSPPGSPVPGILQARTLEWVAISFSNAWKWKVKVKSLSHVQLLATPWTAAYQAPPPMVFSRQEYWSGLPLPSPWSRVTKSHLQQKSWEGYQCFDPHFHLLRIYLKERSKGVSRLIYRALFMT